ncbi:Nucleotidyl transferase AbiEii toxin, Type IV TA system [Jiangella alkaliphila]|uniref:Nucleotidyl transferase AbiEii toxin, Type IV TA system n=1 Tax=Jiangella alkaliphila TaxID=419479 RepID=A0A1H2KKQ8_9ACTN|nr:Nucleotidyl transferase AbiEii toxin, Type IV TA system [Jiangella alkaliphila]
MVVDLLFASSGIEREIAQAAERIEIIPGLTLPVATAGHLIALKLLARDDERRPRDAADLRNLAEVASTEDRDVARKAVELITARGFGRDRDLPQALDSLGIPD